MNQEHGLLLTSGEMWDIHRAMNSTDANKKRIYIAGKVTGLTVVQATFKFGEAEQKLKAAGYDPINPLSLQDTFRVEWKEAMKRCIAALVFCDGIYILPCSSDSKGAQLEILIASQLQLPTITL